MALFRTGATRLRAVVNNGMLGAVSYHKNVSFFPPTHQRFDKTFVVLHKKPEEDKVAICNDQTDSQLDMWPGVWSGDLRAYKKYGHKWHWMSLMKPSVKQHKPHNPSVPKMSKLKPKSKDRPGSRAWPRFFLHVHVCMMSCPIQHKKVSIILWATEWPHGTKWSHGNKLSLYHVILCRSIKTLLVWWCSTHTRIFDRSIVNW